MGMGTRHRREREDPMWINHRGLWSHEAVRFSRYGTLVATVETFVNRSPNGYYASELANELHAEVQEPLRHLVQQQG